jgi:N-acetylmuramoyl-L-alanine amidase
MGARAFNVEKVRFGVHKDKTRMVLELSEAKPFRVFTLSDPYRVVVDLPEMAWKVGNIVKPTGSGVLAIRQGELKPGISRIVIDVNKPVSIRTAYILRKDKGVADRLVVDFSYVSSADFQKDKAKVIGKLLVEENEPLKNETIKEENKQKSSINSATQKESRVINKSETNQTFVTPPVKPSITKKVEPIAAVKPKNIAGVVTPPAKPKVVKFKKPVVVIDPGHGGNDPGAIGSNGVKEKNITIAAAKELKRQLEQTGRYKVLLTRTSDRYIRLYERVGFARNMDADLFISLHADSIERKDVQGASIYTLSKKASDKQTERLAAKENQVDLIGGIDLSAEDSDVADILISLAMTDTQNHSNFFAEVMKDVLAAQGIKTLTKPHRSAGFAVLKAPDIPSILIEMGFMSNKYEAQRLATPAYRKKVASAVVLAVESYFQRVRQGQNN